MNVHSCCSLVCTIANSPGVRAANSSPYTVRDAKVLLCQGRVAVMAGSSFGCWRAVIPPWIEGPSLDIQERFTRILDWESGWLIPVDLTFRSMSMDWVLYAPVSEIRLAVAIGKASGEPPSSLSSKIFFWIWAATSRLSIRTKFTSMIILYTYLVDLEYLRFVDRNACCLLDVALNGRSCCEMRRAMW